RKLPAPVDGSSTSIDEDRPGPHRCADISARPLQSCSRRFWEDNMMKRRQFLAGTAAIAAATIIRPRLTFADQMDAAKKWVENEFQPSTLSKDQQMAQMEWFIKAAQPFKGMDIKVVSETITTHSYESKTLAPAFNE